MFADTFDEDKKEAKNRRKFPLAIFLGILIQSISAIWWAATFSATTENRLNSVETRQRSLDQLPERMARQEAQLESTNALLRDIRDDLRDLKTRRSLGR